jgi:class 3 adenylate cyclase
MDPVALSGTFATLVGLLANFKAERSSTELSEFMAWLKDHHQDQIWTRIDADKRLTQELKVLLARDHGDLVAKLSSLHEQIAHLASQIEGFADLSNHLAPGSALSDQAKGVLRQLVESGAEHAQEIEVDGRRDFLLVGASTRGELSIDEPNFITEDIEALASAGLVRIQYTPRGAVKVLATRLGHRYVGAKDA